MKEMLISLLALGLIIALGIAIICQLPVAFDKDNFTIETYTIKYGDTLWELGKENTKKTETDIDGWISAVCSLNHLNPNMIKEGQTIQIYVEK